MAQENAQALFDITEYIPTGHANAISRKMLAAKTGKDDRANRRAIEESDAPIINTGNGYFIPDPNDPIDMSEAHAYIAIERARARSIEEKIQAKFHDFDTQEQELDER